MTTSTDRHTWRATATTEGRLVGAVAINRPDELASLRAELKAVGDLEPIR